MNTQNGKVNEVRVWCCDKQKLPHQNLIYLNVGLLQMVRPSGEQVLPHLLFEVTSIGNERCREQTVSSDGGHLVLEGFAGLLPAVPFS